MLHLLELDIQKELENPNIREIIRLCAEAEFERRYPVLYEPLERRYPPLKEVIAKMRGDPIEMGRKWISELEESKHKIEMGRKWISELEESKPEILGELFGENQTDQDLYMDVLYMGVLSSYFSIAETYFANSQKLCVHQAKLIEMIASHENIKPEELLKNQKSMDAIERKLFPTRKMAEEFLEAKFGLIGIKLKLTKLAIDSSRHSSGEVDQNLLKEEELLKPIEALIKASLEYETKELDRIYQITQY